MLQGFVYANLRAVYQNRLLEVQAQALVRREGLVKDLERHERDLQFARSHCPNRVTRIVERVSEVQQELKRIDEGAHVVEIEQACQPYLAMLEQQSMDLLDVERFYSAMGVLFRANHFVNASHTHLHLQTPTSANSLESLNLHVCPECDVARVYDEYEAYAICPRCGNAVPFQRESHDSEDTMQYTIQFEYDRANHLREYLNQIIKAEENVASIPKCVIRGIKRQILKERITNRAMITPRRIKEWLKRDLKMSKYSEKVYSILFAVCKVRPPKIPKALEEMFYEMFEQVQKPFARHVPVGRVHFFNYGYLVRKFSELLGQRHLLPVFPILKGTDRVHFQDDIWKKCCADLGWQFIPSI